MHTVQSLISDLSKMGIVGSDTLLVHSSMKAIGGVDGVDGGADTVLDALCTYMAEGLLVLPTHTWGTINPNNPIYSIAETPSCVGILPEFFRKRKGVVRSSHPTHSIAAIGKDASNFTEGDAYFKTPCHRDGPWGRLLDRRAKIMFVGVDLTVNTFMHAIEEWLDIPDNLEQFPQVLFTKRLDGSLQQVQQFRHKGSRSECFNKVRNIFIENGAMTTGKFGSAETFVCDALRMTEILCVMLLSNPMLFSDDKPVDCRLFPMYCQQL